jgi:hypothetical protein
MTVGSRKRRVRATAKLTPMAAFKLRVGFWAAKLRAQPREVVLMRMSRKWASCSRRGRVCFARDLLDQPTGGQDYVIVHELLHLRHANHGRVFRSLMRTHLPHWRVSAETLPPRSPQKRNTRLTATIRLRDRARTRPPAGAQSRVTFQKARHRVPGPIIFPLQCPPPNRRPLRSPSICA